MSATESQHLLLEGRTAEVGSVLAFLLFEGSVVLQHRDEHIAHSPGMLTGFGGGIEPAKDAGPQAAINRELDEEISNLLLASPLKQFGAIPLNERTDATANGPMYLFFARLASVDLTVMEGQGSIAVPLAGIEDWRKPPIVPDALHGLRILRNYVRF